MPVGKKLAIVLSVVIVGVSAALMFSKENSPLRFWSGASDDPFAQHVERRVGAPAWNPNAPVTTAAATAAITQPRPLPPEPATYQTMRPVGTLLAPIDGIVEPGSGRPAEKSAALEASPSSYQSSHALRHTVEDGDTLTKIALRYLGRADAYRRIYDLNRDVLSTPDLLPIGAVLQIPASDSPLTRVEDSPAMMPVPPRP
jgi:nucleoid-associated protein YgaU